MVKPQFSLSVLLMTVAVVAVVLALMVQNAQQYIASVCLILLTFAGLAFSIVVLIFGRDGIRPFGVGAAVPLVCSSIWFTQSALFETIYDPETYGVMVSLHYINWFMGSALLVAIANGYLCIFFRWLVGHRRTKDSQD